MTEKMPETREIQLIPIHRTSLVVSDIPEMPKMKGEKKKEKDMSVKDWILFAVLVYGIFIGMFSSWLIFGY